MNPAFGTPRVNLTTIQKWAVLGDIRQLVHGAHRGLPQELSIAKFRRGGADLFRRPLPFPRDVAFVASP